MFLQRLTRSMPGAAGAGGGEADGAGGGRVLSDPPFRRLSGYALDPSLSTRLETAVINRTTFRVPWERLQPGPVGEYVEVVDVDPASGCVYEPVDLEAPELLAQDGVPPAEGVPQFHQQMVYAVAMTTIGNFERALGRPVLWSERPYEAGDEQGRTEDDEYVPRLRIYPHALRASNAYYSPDKVALLFGYFPAPANDLGEHYAGGMVFTCLSHDIVAHETTHAVLDAIHPYYAEGAHPDAVAFHEAFADIVALFQHFTFPDVLRHQIARTRGDLRGPSLLGELAQQFGRAMGNYGALRAAIGRVNPATKRWEAIEPDPRDYETVMEPHARGAILVAAVFDAFLALYERRTADLIRLASGGSGVLASGALHPDLVGRLAAEASKVAKHVLHMCVRALDYCPPVEVEFGDFLRAVITADADVVPDDDLHYRVAFIEAFRRRGIYPRDIRTLSEESLRWPRPEELAPDEWHAVEYVARELRKQLVAGQYHQGREALFQSMRAQRRWVHGMIQDSAEKRPGLARLLGLELVKMPGPATRGLRMDRGNRPRFSVTALRGIHRVGPDGDLVNQLLMSFVQTREVPSRDGGDPVLFRGGGTLLFDLESSNLRYVIRKAVSGPEAEQRLELQLRLRRDAPEIGLAGSYFGRTREGQEPFAVMHGCHRENQTSI